MSRRVKGPASAFPVRHALRDQESLWAEFLAMGLTAVDSLSKSIAVLCEGRFDVVHEVKSLERASDRAEVRIEQECLRILALFEPVASDLRRMATVLKVNRDWERIADLASTDRQALSQAGEEARRRTGSRAAQVAGPGRTRPGVRRL